MCKIPVLVIVGPTASGKTALSVECAIKLKGEIISADSMQIYKGMSVATAKPTAKEMRGIKHHLIDFLDTSEKYSVADFVKDASKEIMSVYQTGKLPIIAGGTGLYVDSLINNIKFTQADTVFELRERLNEKMEKIGAQKMLDELSEFDKATADRLHPSNKKRIIRAFEVYELTGKTLSELEVESKSEPSPYKPVFIGINFKDRDKLYERINKRVDVMLENGLLEEAKKYYALPYENTAAQAIGYKELKPYFDGEISLENAVENLKLSTRHYAKRQLTWFKRNENIKWFYYDDYQSNEEFLNDVMQYIKREFDNG